MTHHNRSGASRRRNFFSELLPEGRIAQLLAPRAGVRPFDTLGILRAYGLDLAGALVISPYSPSSHNVNQQSSYARVLTDLEEMLNNASQFPLGNLGVSGKISLGVMQEKILLAQIGDEWAACECGFPSNHIPTDAWQCPLIVFITIGISRGRI